MPALSEIDHPPASLAADLAPLRAGLDADLPARTAATVLIGTWNIRDFAGLTAAWQTAVAACGLAGLALWAQHHHPHIDPLHLRVYGPFMVVAILGAYSFRTGDGRWNMRVMAVAALFVALLGVRALWTGY